MAADSILAELKGRLRARLRRLLESLVEPRVDSLAGETEALRAQLVEANDKVEALAQLVERLDLVLREGSR